MGTIRICLPFYDNRYRNLCIIGNLVYWLIALGRRIHHQWFLWLNRSILVVYVELKQKLQQLCLALLRHLVASLNLWAT